MKKNINFMNIYLDIDGVLIVKDSQPAKHVVEFLEYITSNHQVYWLTTHCWGDAKMTVHYLKDKLPAEAIPLLEKIKPTNWQTLKTEAIDFGQDFRWFDDSIGEGEKKVLLDNNSLIRLNNVDLKAYPDYLKVEEYMFKEQEFYQGVPFEYKMQYSSEEFEKIVQGYYAPEKGMDERWRFIFNGQDLYILRSWSNWVAYHIKFKELGDSYVSEQAVTYFEKTSEGIFWSNYHAKSVFLLIESYLLGLDLWFLITSGIDETLKIDINGLHGFNHWKNVYRNGMMLANKHNLDKDVITHFAFLHDVGRENEYTDINHGKRSASLIKMISNEIKLNSEQKSLLIEAVANHSDAYYKSKNETVMACLDSDRLDLPRVGTIVDKKYLYFK